MSMESSYYVIAGYDLTGCETDKFKDWKWTEEGEDYINNQCKGEIQFFDDPMSGSYLYFGYVLADGDEYGFDTTSFEVSDIEKCSGKVKSELVKLQEMGIITKDPHFNPVFKVIVFEECRQKEEVKRMNIEQIKEKLKTDEYDFLREDKNLGDNIILLTLGGSHAYGMDKEGSDLDVRGIALNSKKDVLLGTDFEQVVNVDTDTTIYSFNKMIQLLTSNNPNTVEILGCKPEHYLHLSNIGRELLENRKMFLSKICIHTFGGYAGSQLRRMENKAARLVGQAQNEAYILKSINNAKYDFKSRYYPHDDSDVKLYIDTAVQEGYDSEIFMDVCLKHYPLRDWTGMWNEMKAIVSSYNKIGKRNEKAISHDKLGKHMAHLIRLYMMCIDILEKEEIITYRTDEHDLLMGIRNGEYLDENRQPTTEFYDLLNEYEKRFDYAKNNTSLPDVPDHKRINEFKMSVNERIVKGEV